jgi:hypothetical protein
MLTGSSRVLCHPRFIFERVRDSTDVAGEELELHVLNESLFFILEFRVGTRRWISF